MNNPSTVYRIEHYHATVPEYDTLIALLQSEFFLIVRQRDEAVKLLKAIRKNFDFAGGNVEALALVLDTQLTKIEEGRC